METTSIYSGCSAPGCALITLFPSALGRPGGRRDVRLRAVGGLLTWGWPGAASESSLTSSTGTV